MRRNYISPEFVYKKVNGTLSMSEESTFFGAKMLEVEDSILISNENMIWNQRANGEQIDNITETTLAPKLYSSSDSMAVNHTIYIDETQTPSKKDSTTRWIIDIDISKILNEYLFAKLKRNRTFEGVRTQMTVYNDIDTAIKKYVELNVNNRYSLNRVDLYVEYIDLKSQSVLRYQNTWSPAVSIEANKTNKFQTISDFNQNNIRILFDQQQPSTQFKFNYFFNLYFEKI
jgi:hypothetical protein